MALTPFNPSMINNKFIVGISDRCRHLLPGDVHIDLPAAIIQIIEKAGPHSILGRVNMFEATSSYYRLIVCTIMVKKGPDGKPLFGTWKHLHESGGLSTRMTHETYVTLEDVCCWRYLDGDKDEVDTGILCLYETLAMASFNDYHRQIEVRSGDRNKIVPGTNPHPIGFTRSRRLETCVGPTQGVIYLQVVNPNDDPAIEQLNPANTYFSWLSAEEIEGIKNPDLHTKHKDKYEKTFGGFSSDIVREIKNINTLASYILNQQGN